MSCAMYVQKHLDFGFHDKPKSARQTIPIVPKRIELLTEKSYAALELR